MGEEAQADEGAGEVEEGQDRSGVAIIADCQLPEGHDPANAPQVLAGVHAPGSDPRRDPPLPQGAAQVGVVVPLDRVQLRRALPGGTESDVRWVIDLSDVTEPSNWEAACVRTDEWEEAARAEDEASRTAYMPSGWRATLRSSRSISMFIG
jgi:hypothetical protein